MRGPHPDSDFTSAYRDGQHIEVSRLSHPRHSQNIISHIKDAIRAGYEEIDIDFSEVTAAYSNTIVPIAALGPTLAAQNIILTYSGRSDYLELTSIHNPIAVSEDQAQLTGACLDRVWRFNTAEEVYGYIRHLMVEIAQHVTCERGVLEAIEWSLNEVMDNVLQHSRTSTGFVMAQMHRSKKHLGVCVHDFGQGIYNSFRGSKYAPKNPGDAIALAIKEGVTRDPSVGQGNGMWGLHSIVGASDGILAITSGGSALLFNQGRIKPLSGLPSLTRDQAGTTVDFQINTHKSISLSNILSSSDGRRKYQSFSHYIEQFETEANHLRYSLRDQTSGTGTRVSGKRCRLEVLNIHQQAQRPVIIDFSDVAIVSSSFADEFIGKMVVELGFMNFNTTIRMIGMNATIQAIVERSVAMRMASAISAPK